MYSINLSDSTKVYYPIMEKDILCPSFSCMLWRALKKQQNNSWVILYTNTCILLYSHLIYPWKLFSRVTIACWVLRWRIMCKVLCISWLKCDEVKNALMHMQCICISFVAEFRINCVYVVKKLFKEVVLWW